MKSAKAKGGYINYIPLYNLSCRTQHFSSTTFASELCKLWRPAEDVYISISKYNTINCSRKILGVAISVKPDDRDKIGVILASKPIGSDDGSTKG
jgi:hypothetical protein